jgi:hypothetical protein
MKVKKLSIKRKDNGKHVVNKNSLEQSRLKADHLKSVGKGSGIVDALLPSTQLEKKALDSLKQTYVVDEVVAREKRSQINQELREYFNNDTFIVALAEWWGKYFTGRITIERISKELSEAQKQINEEMVTEPKLVQLKNIFDRYAPELRGCPRETQWWEAQISNRRKSLKIK